jgi:hypothetical protein
VWWLGFDCAHCFDYFTMALPIPVRSAVRWGEYRDVAYVEREVERLADQCRDRVRPARGDHRHWWWAGQERLARERIRAAMECRLDLN